MQAASIKIYPGEQISQVILFEQEIQFDEHWINFPFKTLR